jgi:HSP20 family protein
MVMPPRSHHSGGTTERHLGWARNPLTAFDELLTQMSGLLESMRRAAPRPQPRGPPLADVTETDDAFEVGI